MKKSLIVLGVILLVSALVLNCKHLPILPTDVRPTDTTQIPEPTVTGGHPCSPDSVYFINDILPLIVSSCAKSGCHDATSHKEGVVLTDYTHIMNYVTPYNGTGSKLYRQLVKTGDERMPPQPDPPFTPEQKAMIAKWINQGAQNNYCDGLCDTVTTTYSTVISPLINSYCKGCHSGASPSGNIDLSTYAGVQTIALNGKLYGAVHGVGYIKMPPSGALTECQLRELDLWIGSGAPNN